MCRKGHILGIRDSRGPQKHRSEDTLSLITRLPIGLPWREGLGLITHPYLWFCVGSGRAHSITIATTNLTLLLRVVPTSIQLHPPHATSLRTIKPIVSPHPTLSNVLKRRLQPALFLLYLRMWSGHRGGGLVISHPCRLRLQEFRSAIPSFHLNDNTHYCVPVHHHTFNSIVALDIRKRALATCPRETEEKAKKWSSLWLPFRLSSGLGSRSLFMYNLL